MNYRYYIGQGEPVIKLLSELVSAMTYASVFQDALIASVGAKNLFFYSSEPEIPRGFVFSKRQEREGLRFGAAVAGGFTYFPDTATEKGIELQNALYDSRLRFHPETWLLRRLKITAEARGYCEHCRNVHALYKSHAAWMDNQSAVYLKIPAEAVPYPEIPDWFVEVKESEWLAGQGK